jgi:predicted transcriptional regulator
MTRTISHHYPELRTSKRVLIVRLGQKEKLTKDQIIDVLGLGEQACKRVIEDLAKMGYVDWNKEVAKITQMGKEYLMERKISLGLSIGL